MDKDNLTAVLGEMGLVKARVFESSRQMQVECPLAPWVHEKGTDSRPSCSIRIDDEGPSLFFCFSCHNGGLFARLVRLWAAHVEEKWALDLAEKVGRLEDVPLESMLERAKSKLAEKKAVRDKLETWDERELAEFAGRVPRYALRRGIKIEVAKRWGLGYDVEGKRLTFPVRRLDGKLVGLQGRAIHDHVMPPWFNYWRFEKSRFLYGEHDVERGRRCVLVEGPFDVLTWRGYGIPNVLGIMGSSFSEVQRQKLLSISDAVVLVLDNDEAGRVGARKIMKRLKGRARIWCCELPRGKDPDDLSEAEAHGILSTAKLTL